MKTIESKIQVGTKVIVAGDPDGKVWRTVKSIADHKKSLSVDGLDGSFQRGHIIKFTNK